jgi:hypothetical protein
MDIQDMAKTKELIETTYQKATIVTHLEKSLSQMSYKALCLIVFHVNAGGKKIGGKYYLKKNFAHRLTLDWKSKSKGKEDPFYQGLDELYDNEIIWNYLGKDYAFNKTRMRLLIQLSEPNHKGHYYAFALHPELEEYIKNPKIYGQQRIIMMAVLNKPKSCFRLYDILIDAYSRKENPFRIQLEDLLRELGFAEKKGYQRWTDFKKYILAPNLKAINEKSDLKVSYHVFKKGKKVDGCIFELKKQNWQMPFNEMLLEEIRSNYIKEEQNNIVLVGETISSKEAQNFIDEMYEKYKVSKDVSQKAIELYGFKETTEIRDYALSMHAKNKKTNFAAYMGDCLRKGHGVKTSEERKLEDETKAIQKQKKIKEQEKAIIDELKFELEAQRREALAEQMNKLSANKLKKLEENFVREVVEPNSVYTKIYENDGLNGRGLKMAFRFYASEQFLQPFDSEFEDFAKSKGFKVVKVGEEWQLNND